MVQSNETISLKNHFFTIYWNIDNAENYRVRLFQIKKKEQNFLKFHLNFNQLIKNHSAKFI